ncbi:hypothetical protein SAMN05444680_1132 [Variovorax sp. YR216]|nr:hypothetical protein SAMN05444680_1132 [Variovorax sp. YR216]
MAVDLEALDFEPNIFEMLDRLGISHEFSAPALRTLVEMLSTPLGQGKR